MNPKHLVSLAIALGAAWAGSGAVAGTVWSELPPGAGDSLATAQITSDGQLGAIDRIQGTLSAVVPVGAVGPRNEVDIYRIGIVDTATFSARTLSSNPDDTALFLFDAGGMGIEMNDDTGVDLLSALPGFGGLAGIYYLAVALGGFEALDGVANAVFQLGAFTDVRPGDPASGALAGWSDTFQSLNELGLGYTIELTGVRAAMPEPSVLALLGLAGCAAWRARRRPAVARAAA